MLFWFVLFQFSPSQGEYKWLFQLLFGRYRKLDGIGWEYFVILGTVAGATVVGYAALLMRRLSWYKDLLAAIMPLDHSERKNGCVTADANRSRNASLTARIPSYRLRMEKRDMSRKMYSDIVSAMVEMDRIREQNLIPQHVGEGDPGWGRDDDGQVSGVHFNTVIMHSYYVLESAALQRRPNLHIRDSRSIRDYVLLLESEFPAITHEKCTQYIQTFERARFGKHKFTHTEYVQFMNVVFEMVAIMTESNIIRRPLSE